MNSTFEREIGLQIYAWFIQSFVHLQRGGKQEAEPSDPPK